MSEECGNILVRGVNWLGDAVMTMPALRSLRRSTPNATITLLAKPAVAALFEKDPSVDDIILYAEEHRGLRGKVRLSRLIRERTFCRAVLFQNAFDAALLAFLARIPERIGYDRDGRGLLLTTAIPADEKMRSVHHIEYYQNLVERAGFRRTDSLPWIYLTLDERLRAREKLRGLRRPVVGINPGAAYGSSKRWFPERFASVASRIMREREGSAVFFGGPAEKGVAEEVLRHLPSGDSSFLNLAGKTSVRELAALISECDVLATNDSGPMHIGYAVGTPLVAIFGSTSPEMTGPVNGGSVVIKKDADCAPCFERSCKRKDMRCMDLVSANEVSDAVQRAIPAKRAVFFDRDGTLCRDAGYLNRMEDFALFPDITRLRRLKERGFLLIGVSNQSGISRGTVQERFVKEVNDIFLRDYGFDGFYYCPHHPDERCSCRKPEPGLLVRARKDFGIDLKASFVVGDKELDMLLAKAVGAQAVHVATGQEDRAEHAEFRVGNLSEAVEIIERHA